MNPRDNDEEFIKFCNSHTMKEIKEVYGNAGRNRCYNAKVPIKFKKAEPKVGDKKKNIINDLRAGISQTVIARKYEVSRQYVFKVKMEMGNLNG